MAVTKKPAAPKKSGCRPCCGGGMKKTTAAAKPVKKAPVKS